MKVKATLKNDVRASYTDTLIPAGTEIEVAHTPPTEIMKMTNKPLTTNHDTFLYAILVYKNKAENLHIAREDVVGGENIEIE